MNKFILVKEKSGSMYIDRSKLIYFNKRSIGTRYNSGSYSLDIRTGSWYNNSEFVHTKLKIKHAI